VHAGNFCFLTIAEQGGNVIMSHARCLKASDALWGCSGASLQSSVHGELCRQSDSVKACE
jgi:hypothetical protein